MSVFSTMRSRINECRFLCSMTGDLVLKQVYNLRPTRILCIDLDTTVNESVKSLMYLLCKPCCNCNPVSLLVFRYCSAVLSRLGLLSGIFLTLLVTPQNNYASGATLSDDAIKTASFKKLIKWSPYKE